MLIIALHQDLRYNSVRHESELTEQIRLARRAISTIWKTFLPHKSRVLQLVVWEGGDRSQGSYDQDGRRIWLQMHNLCWWTATTGLDIAQAVVLIAAHEAVHAVHDGKGVEVFVSSDSTGRLKDEYWDHWQEQEARRIAGALFEAAYPGVAVPTDWSGAGVDETTRTLLSELWHTQPEEKDWCIEISEERDVFVAPSRRWQRFALRKLLNTRTLYLRLRYRLRKRAR